jgi:hypothetical protein
MFALQSQLEDQPRTSFCNMVFSHWISGVNECCKQLDGVSGGNVKPGCGSNLMARQSTRTNLQENNALKPKNIDKNALIAVNKMMDHLIAEVRIIAS